MAECYSYAIEGAPESGPCLHPAGYQTAGDGVEDYCACHYPGEVYDASECSSAALALRAVKTHDGSRGYQLPDGTVVTEEAWKDMVPEFRRALIERASYQEQLQTLERQRKLLDDCTTELNALRRIIAALVHQNPDHELVVADSTLVDMDTDVDIRTMHDARINASRITTSAWEE